MVREDLTVEAIEKDSPVYRGRTYNKMLNNGAKGQYLRRAASKLLWNGIPEVVAPSWYTSRTCLTHAEIVDKQHRKGESIYLPCCGCQATRKLTHPTTRILTPLVCEPVGCLERRP